MDNKRGILRRVFGVVAIGWMVLIFILSSADGGQSDQIVSSAWNDIASHDLKVIVPENIKGFHFSLRNWGHVYLFAILGLFIMLWAVCESKLRTNKIKLTVAGVICFLYSLFDEIHQLFVSGRNFEIEDLFYDFIGYSTCITVLLLLYRLYNQVREILIE